MPYNNNNDDDGDDDEKYTEIKRMPTNICKSVHMCVCTFVSVPLPPPHFFDLGAMVCLCPPPLLTPHFYFPLELYVYITLTNNYLAFFIYQLSCGQFQ